MKDGSLANNLVRFLCSLVAFGVGYWLADKTEVSATWSLGTSGEITVNAIGGAALFALVWLTWQFKGHSSDNNSGNGNGGSDGAGGGGGGSPINTTGPNSPVITGDNSSVTYEGASSEELRLLREELADFRRKFEADRPAAAEAVQNITSDDETFERASTRYVSDRKHAGITYQQLLDELRQGTPETLYSFIDEQIKTQGDDLVELHRERAVIGYRLGKIDDAKRSLKSILAHKPNDADAINRLGVIAYLHGDLDTAFAQYTQLLEADPDDRIRAVALGNLGLVAQTRGDLDEALRLYRESCEIDKQLDYPAGQASALGNMGNVAQIRGMLEKATQLYSESLDIYTRLGRLEGQAKTLNNMGVIAKTRGEFDQAMRLYREAHKIYVSLGNLEGQATLYSNMGVVAHLRGNHDDAMIHYCESLRIYKQLGSINGQAIALGNMGIVSKLRNDLDQAQRYYNEALELAKQHGNLERQGIQLANLGNVAQTRGDLPEARRLWTDALELFDRVGMASEIEEVKGWLAELPPE